MVLPTTIALPSFWSLAEIIAQLVPAIGKKMVKHSSPIACTELRYDFEQIALELGILNCNQYYSL